MHLLLLIFIFDQRFIYCYYSDVFLITQNLSLRPGSLGVHNESNNYVGTKFTSL